MLSQNDVRSIRYKYAARIGKPKPPRNLKKPPMTNIKKRYTELGKEQQMSILIAFITETGKTEMTMRRLMTSPNPDMRTLEFFARQFGIRMDDLIEPDTEKKRVDQPVAA